MFSAIIFIIVLSVLGFIFVPKIKSWKRRDDNTRIRMSSQDRSNTLASDVDVPVPVLNSSIVKPGAVVDENNDLALQDELNEARETISLLKKELEELKSLQKVKEGNGDA